jgi:hypothetical protein
LVDHCLLGIDLLPGDGLLEADITREIALGVRQIGLVLRLLASA